jgi:hypothetical protein
MLKVFKRLTGPKGHEAIAHESFRDIYAAYGNLKEKRNWLAHGNPAATYAIHDADIFRAVNAAAAMFPCFAHLHHTLCLIDGPTMPGAET